ncbi:MAG: hypothetical protein Q3959_05220 [Limosilactobacillus sp.]|uniref:hypothetical protein n=1 Tax=Limosilactobacillus sp. TaxID=2773925 RepID=UPI00270F1097|nr:hypothetical protein [Limosilactobacillus sp.]
MSLTGTLLIIALVALILFILKFIHQMFRVKKGIQEVSGFNVFVNWMIMMVFFFSLIGAGIFQLTGKGGSPIAANQQAVKETSSSSSKEDKALKLSFEKDVTMDNTGEVTIAIKVTGGAKVKVTGRNTGEKYASFTAKDSDGMVTKKIKLDIAGPYKVTATLNGKKVSKNLVVREAYSYSSSSSSKSSSSSSSSQSSSQANNNNNNYRRPTNNYSAPAQSSQPSESSSSTAPSQVDNNSGSGDGAADQQ